MDKIKVLNDLKALEMTKRSIHHLMDQTCLNNPFQNNVNISIDGGKNISVNVDALKEFLEHEMKRTKIKYDDTLKSLIDDEGGF